MTRYNNQERWEVTGIFGVVAAISSGCSCKMVRNFSPHEFAFKNIIKL
jgi:hypothetical protein